MSDEPRLWTSKVVGHDRVAPSKLVAHPLNHRTHPPAQQAAVKASIDEIGFIRSVTVNRVTGHIIDGHERVRQAVQSGQPWIDVEYVDLSAQDERKALAVLDRSAELAELDAEVVEELLKQTDFDDEALRNLVSEMASEAEVCFDVAGTAAEPQLGELQYSILVECADERRQTELLERFEAEGLACRAWIV
jgi:ParB-like chromosome segregation protein Spo0J